jgi:hypothetical protein
MTFDERVEAMMSLSHNNMQLGKLVELVSKLFTYVPANVSAPLYCEWSEAYRAALQDMQDSYNLGVTEERTKCVALMTKLHPTLNQQTNE